MSGTEAITTKRWKPRLWQLLVGAIIFALLACVVVLQVMRANGRARWFAYVEAEQAAGRPITLDYFVTKAPPIDRAAQAAWDGWATSFVSTPSTSARLSGARSASQILSNSLPKHRPAWGAWVTGHGPLPDAVPELIANAEKGLLPALIALRSGKLVLSSFDWAGKPLTPSWWHVSPPGGHSLRGPNWSTEPVLAEWLHHHAVLSDDPTQDLADLDTLHTDLARPAIPQDAHVAITVARVRDQTYLELAIRDRLPTSARERWLVETNRAVEIAGDGLLGERIIAPSHFTTYIDTGLVRFLDTQIGSWWSWRSPGQCAQLTWMWATGWDSLPQIAAFTDQAAACLRGDTSAPFPDLDKLKADLPWFGRYSLAPKLELQLRYLIDLAIAQEANHREARLAVRILALSHDGGLPADQAEMLARMGDAQTSLVRQNRLTLRYERPAPDRFRLVVDPVSPVPDFDTPAGMSARTKAAGSPPSTSPLTIGPFIEIQLPPTP